MYYTNIVCENFDLCGGFISIVLQDMKWHMYCSHCGNKGEVNLEDFRENIVEKPKKNESGTIAQNI